MLGFVLVVLLLADCAAVVACGVGYARAVERIRRGPPNAGKNGTGSVRALPVPLPGSERLGARSEPVRSSRDRPGLTAMKVRYTNLHRLSDAPGKTAEMSQQSGWGTRNSSPDVGAVSTPPAGGSVKNERAPAAACVEAVLVERLSALAGRVNATASHLDAFHSRAAVVVGPMLREIRAELLDLAAGVRS